MRYLAIASAALLAIGTAAVVAAPDTNSAPASTDSAKTDTAMPGDQASQTVNPTTGQTTKQVASNPKQTTMPDPKAGTDDKGAPNAAVTNGGEMAQ